MSERISNRTVSFSDDTVKLGKEYLREIGRDGLVVEDNLTILTNSPIGTLVKIIDEISSSLAQKLDEPICEEPLFDLIKKLKDQYKAGHTTKLNIAKTIRSKLIEPDCPQGGISLLADYVIDIVERFEAIKRNISEYDAFVLSGISYREIQNRKSEIEQARVNSTSSELTDSAVSPINQIQITLPDALAELGSASFYAGSIDAKRDPYQYERVRGRAAWTFEQIDLLLIECLRLNQVQEQRWSTDTTELITELVASVSALRLGMIYFRNSFAKAMKIAKGAI